VPAPALSHERVHEKIKLSAAIVRRSGSGHEAEVVVYHRYKLFAMSETAPLKLPLDVVVHVVLVAPIDQDVVHVGALFVAAGEGVVRGPENSIRRKLPQHVGDEIGAGGRDVRGHPHHWIRSTHRRG